jgi:hypothetical protein
MPNQLHVVVRTPDELLRELMTALQKRPDGSVEVVDLTQGAPDYPRLVERIFASDSVVVW